MSEITFSRQTGESEIAGIIRVRGSGKATIVTECGFFNHMLQQLAFYSGIDIALEAKADTHVDYHHLVEDVGLAIGGALREAAGDRRGLKRFGHVLLPMDDALVMVALDLGGRPYLRYDVNLKSTTVGNFDTELVQEFLRGLTNTAGVTLHVQLMAGMNTHHIIEAVFKGLGVCLKQAFAYDGSSDIRSTKGIIQQVIS